MDVAPVLSERWKWYFVKESKGSYSLDLGMEIGLAVAFKPKLRLELGCQPHVLIGMAPTVRVEIKKQPMIACICE